VEDGLVKLGRPTLLAVVGVAALAAAPASLGAAVHKPQTKKVLVADNYYGPTKLTVNKGSKILWHWDPNAIEDHDVKLTSGPKGEKKFQSEPGGTGYTYARTLKTPGVYKILCTFHPDMTMTITVRK
jgi:plastocyanin